MGDLYIKKPKQREDWVLLETEGCPSLKSGVGWHDLEGVIDTMENVEANIAPLYGDKREDRILTQKQCKLRYYHTEQG
jgi:hypothetical protein